MWDDSWYFAGAKSKENVHLLLPSMNCCSYMVLRQYRRFLFSPEVLHLSEQSPDTTFYQIHDCSGALAYFLNTPAQTAADCYSLTRNVIHHWCWEKTFAPTVKKHSPAQESRTRIANVNTGLEILDYLTSAQPQNNVSEFRFIQESNLK